MWTSSILESYNESAIDEGLCDGHRIVGRPIRCIIDGDGDIVWKEAISNQRLLLTAARAPA